MKALVALRVVFIICALTALVLAIRQQSIAFIFGFLTFSWATYSIHNSLHRIKRNN